MQTLGLDEEPAAAVDANSPPTGFWKRQFQQGPTAKQTIFDWAFGVLLPVACIFFDPIVFEGNGDRALLGTYKPFAYLFTFASMMGLMAWLLWSDRLKGVSAAVAGLLFAGGTVALVLGMILFPFSAIGLIVLIGALGFTPLFTAYVFFRNAVRSARVGRGFLDKRVFAGSAVLAGLFAIVIPYVVNTEIERKLTRMETCDQVEFQANARALRPFAPLLNLDRLKRNTVPRFPNGELSTSRAREVSEFYKEIKGKEVIAAPLTFE